MKNRKRLILGVGLAACASLCIGIYTTNMQNMKASAAVTREERMTVDGFSVRVNVSPEDTTGEGVRFHVGMTTALYESLLNTERTAFRDGVTTGTIIIPTQLKSGDLNVNTDKAIKKETTNSWFVRKDADEQVTGMQSIVYLWDIPSTNYGNDISVVGYINDNGNVTYSDELAHSMSWVAKDEYDDPNTDFDAAMLAQLKEKYIDKKVTYHNGDAEEEDTVEYGATLSVVDPEKAGYTFGGWYNQAGTAKWDMENEVINPINLYAQWNRNKGYEVLVDPNTTEASDYEIRSRKDDASMGPVSKLEPEIVDGTSTIGTTEKVIKVNTASGSTAVTGAGSGHYLFHCKNLTRERLQNFDYVTINGYADVERDSGFRFFAADGWTNVAATESTHLKGAFSYTIPKEYLTDDTFRFDFGDHTGSNANRLQNFYIISIVGGYNEVETDETLNLLTKTGLTATELAGTCFKNADGTKTPIDDLAAFTPEEAGKIILKYNVKGYVASQQEINVVALSAYNDFLRLGLKDEDIYTVTQRGATTELTAITETIVDGNDTPANVNGKVLFVDLTNSPVRQGHIQLNISGVTLDQLQHFDYYTLVGYIDYNGSNFTVGSMSAIQTVDRLENEKLDFTFKVKSDYFSEGVKFCFGDYTYNSNVHPEKLYIISITGGYDDVAISGEPFDLLTMTGFTETELAGSYFVPTGGTQENISNLAAFTPSTAGKIVLVITKEGYKQTTVEINVTAEA